MTAHHGMSCIKNKVHSSIKVTSCVRNTSLESIFKPPTWENISAIMSTKKATPRFPLIPITYSPNWDFSDHVTIFNIEMTLNHNVFIRCLNTIYEHAPSIPASSSDVIPFAGYALAWISNIMPTTTARRTLSSLFSRRTSLTICRRISRSTKRSGKGWTRSRDI